MPTSYSLSEAAADCYAALKGRRENVCDTAEELAEITIPSVFPPEDYIEGDKLYVPNQSHNAMCVNNLANVLMYTGLPPGQPMIAYSILEHRLKPAEAQDPQVWGLMKLALARLEVVHRQRMETTALRTTLVEYIKLLAITGNALWEHTELDAPVCWSMRHYAVKRDKLGRPRYVVLKRCVYWGDLDEETQDFLRQNDKSLEWQDGAPKDGLKAKIDIYAACKWDYSGGPFGSWEYWQEIASGKRVPSTEARGGEEIPPPLYPGWMIPIYGFDWGRSYCEEYRGDLYIVENDHHALNDGAAAASFTLLMNDPAGVTSTDDVREADNLDVIAGRADDVTMLRSEKGQDYQFVVQHGQAAEKRLERVFLMNISIQRQAERVTREEIIRVSQDIDRAVGGLHTQFAQTSLRHIITRFIWLHERSDTQVPRLGDLAGGKLVRVAVVTGVDALGRSVEEEQLVSYVTTLGAALTPQVAAQIIDPSDFARRLAAAKGIKPEGLVKDSATLAQEQQQAQQQALMQQATAPVAGEAAKAVGQMAVNNYSQPPQQ